MYYIHIYAPQRGGIPQGVPCQGPVPRVSQVHSVLHSRLHSHPRHPACPTSIQYRGGKREPDTFSRFTMRVGYARGSTLKGALQLLSNHSK